MASQSWTFGPGGIYTATWDGVQTLTVTLTAGGAFVESFTGQSLAGLTSSPQFLALSAVSATGGPAVPLPAADTGSSLSGVVPAYDALPRSQLSASAAVLTSQTLLVNRLLVPGGTVLSSLGFFSGGQAAVTPANWWMVLTTSARVILGVTADQGSAAIGTFAAKNLPMTGPVVVPGPSTALTFLYVGLMVNAATVPTLESSATVGAGSTPPMLCAYSSTLQTTPPAAGATIAALSAPSLVAMSALWAF